MKPGSLTLCLFPIYQIGQAATGSTNKCALVITNFVRPLTVNQVKRMLAEFGEVEVLWMDNIRTHCYVTVSALVETVVVSVYICL